MKHLKFLFPVLLCTLLLGLSSCKETNADRLRAMRGDWKSVKNAGADYVINNLSELIALIQEVELF